MVEAKNGDPRRAQLVAFVAISALLHLAGMLLLVRVSPIFPSLPDQVTGDTNWVDIEVAPEPPKGFEPEEQKLPEATPIALVETPPPETSLPEEPGDNGEPKLDAGMAPMDAAVAVARPTSEDAGTIANTTDAGVVAHAPDDAGAPRDAGAGLAAQETADAAVAVVQGPPPGAQADFRPFVPVGDVVSVLLRFDRVRGTPWVKEAEAILAPMPDYRMIVGTRTLDIANLFDSLFITTPRPNDVTATTLVGRTSQSPTSVRALLDNPKAPIAWYPGQGGAIGKRATTTLMHPADRRVYVMPEPGLVVLAHPANLGALAVIAPSNSLAAVAGPGSLPPWLDKARLVQDEAGVDRGPFLVVTVQGLATGFQVPDFVPGLGALPIPGRMALALEAVEDGFLLRGTAYFEDATLAKRFVATLHSLQGKVDRIGYRQLLARLNLRHAIRGMSLTRKDQTVTLATSLSIADGRAAIREAAERTKAFYSVR